MGERHPEGVARSRWSSMPSWMRWTIMSLVLGVGLVAAVIAWRAECVRTYHARERREYVADSLRLARNIATWAQVDSLVSAGGAAVVADLSDKDLRIAAGKAASRSAPEVRAVLAAELSRREVLRYEEKLRYRISRVTAKAVENGRADDPKARRQKIREAIAAHPDWSDQTLADVVCGVVRLGMTKDQVRAARGGPDRVRRTGTSEGLTELWIYDDWLDTYLYFHDAVLVAWED